MKALIICADNFEDSELLVPYYRLKEADIEVAVASLSSSGHSRFEYRP
jgi:protease I